MDQTVYDCCIVGAGVSGLAAAQLLSRSGFSVVVLEAQDRAGGRVRPVHLGANLLPSEVATRYPPVEVQVGANWIHDLRPANPIYRLAKEENLWLHRTSCGSAFGPDSIIADRQYYYDMGHPRWMTNAEKAEGNKVVEGMVKEESMLRRRLQKKLTGKARHDFSLQEALDRLEHRLSQKGFNINNLATQQLLALNREFQGFSEGFDLRDVSFTRLYDEAVGDDEHGEGIICGGTSLLLPILTRDLDIRYDCPVNYISWESCQSMDRNCSARELISISVKSGKCFHASNVIITVPVGVLKAELITFDPKLPKCVSEGINSCKMGLMNIVVLRFESVFWDMATTLFAACPQVKGQGSNTRDSESEHRSDLFSHFYNLTLMRKPIETNVPPLLLCEIHGEKALMIENMTLSDIALKAMETLKVIFGDATQMPIGCITHKWGKDEFCFGSWNNYSIGVTPAHIKALNTPLCNCNSLTSSTKSCLQFAGEGTSPGNMATLQGAYESGVRASLHIINRHRQSSIVM